ncbi:MAG: TIR domain-containing protein [Gallionella sp.]|nr:TIR domain-containing protein [Gallionella sp.]
MSDQYTFDVFLSHSSKDKDAVRAIAERLKGDGLRVWLDEWELKPGDHIPAKIEDGLEHSRVLVLCMSANAFSSDWATLEAGTFRFRDPLNKDRRFIPLRLDDAPIKSSLAQFLYIDWFAGDSEKFYSKLLEACRPPVSLTVKGEQSKIKLYKKTIQLDSPVHSMAYAFSPDGKRLLSGGTGHTTAQPNTPCDSMRLWDMETGRCLRTFENYTARIECIAWSADQRLAVTASSDKTARLWDVESGRCLHVLEGHTNYVFGVALSGDQRFALSCSFDLTIRIWDVQSGQCVRVLLDHKGFVRNAMWSSDQCYILSCGDDNTVRLWDAVSGRCLRVFEGHTNWVISVAWSPDQRFALSGSCDKTMRLWDVESGRCLRVFEGHTSNVEYIAWNANQRFAISGSPDKTVRLWDVESGQCLQVLEGHTNHIRSLAWCADQRYAFSGGMENDVRVWDLSEFVTATRMQHGVATTSQNVPDQVQYTNAKVLLVGESSAGKTGLSKALSGEHWQPSDSTVGAWATQWKLPVASGDGIEREIWLWDFGGQADQRLIHQLYMDDAALAILVFDGQKDNLFETLSQWDRELTRASHKPFAKLLVAGRVDAGGLRVGRAQVDAFVNERGYAKFLETSAKQNIGCNELKQAIFDGISWDDIPCRTTLVLYKQLKEEIVRLKDVGRVLMRFNELRETLQLGLSSVRFSDDELRTVISLLAGPGVVWELKFGSWVLLQPERINAYAQAVIQTMRADEYERGCLAEGAVLSGELIYHSSLERLSTDDERIILQAMLQSLLERGICLREQTDMGTLLIFPSYYRREREELIDAPAMLVSYRFHGFLDEVYASLVVRLHHTKPFQQDKLWRYAADFKTLTSKQLGIKLTRMGEGTGELSVYFGPTIPVEEKIIFAKYVHEHLLQNAKNVERMRHYVCPHCGTPAGNREVTMKKLAEGKKDIPCINCDDPDKRIPLWDEMEELFASPEIKQQVHMLREESAIELDNESKERALVGEVISTVALAGQISREFNVSDHGIDMEIEFKSDNGEATGEKLYLQLKSGDSYLRERKSDGVEIFTIQKDRHLHYWMAQKFPVLLVIRNSEGEVRWMEIRELLKRESDNGKKSIRQFAYQGERFDVMSVRKWRANLLRVG